MTNPTNKFRDLPRAARWGIVAVGLLVAYFLVIEPVIDTINKVNSKADDRIGQLVALTHDPSGNAADIALGVRKFGEVLLPGDEQTRSVAFNRRVSAILAKHKINDNSTTRKMPLGQGPLKDVYGDASRIDRLVREVQFEGTPEDIAAVISELESAPEVAAVSRIQIRHGDQKDTAGRILKATVSAEAWIVSEKGRGR